MFTHEEGLPKVRHKRAGQGMTAKEKTARLNAAFDAMGDDLSQDELAAMIGVRTIAEVRLQRKAIRALARRHGDLCFLVRWESKDVWHHQIQLCKDLSAILGLRPYLFDYKAFDQADREGILEKAISL